LTTIDRRHQCVRGITGDQIPWEIADWMII